MPSPAVPPRAPAPATKTVSKIQDALSHAGAELTKAVDSVADQVKNTTPKT